MPNYVVAIITAVIVVAAGVTLGYIVVLILRILVWTMRSPKRLLVFLAAIVAGFVLTALVLRLLPDEYQAVPAYLLEGAG